MECNKQWDLVLKQNKKSLDITTCEYLHYAQVITNILTNTNVVVLNVQNLRNIYEALFNRGDHFVFASTLDNL